jgi:hypothetical protein
MLTSELVRAVEANEAARWAKNHIAESTAEEVPIVLEEPISGVHGVVLLIPRRATDNESGMKMMSARAMRDHGDIPVFVEPEPRWEPEIEEEVPEISIAETVDEEARRLGRVGPDDPDMRTDPA